MALAVWRSGRWERRVIREELATEVGRSVTPEEYQAIVDDRNSGLAASTIRRRQQRL
jgi:hypothetical protein